MADYPEEAFRDETVPKLYNYGSDKRLTMRSVKLFADGNFQSSSEVVLSKLTFYRCLGIMGCRSTRAIYR